ncbi:hypothetical protein D3C74_184750 [compost metagenome]
MIWSALFIHPTSRIIAGFAVTLVLVLGGLRENNSDFGSGWLPGWYPDAYVALAAGLSAQPILAGISDAVTKRRISRAIRDGLDEGLGKLVERIRDVARITTGTGWTNHEARAFERHAVEALQHLFTMAGLPDPRVCFYVISTTDDTDADSTGNPVVQQLTYVHHYPKQRPTAMFIRGEVESEGMFEALDTGQPSRVKNRPDYNPELHNWRSALRVPVQHEQTRWGILTLDSPQKSATSSGYADILEFGAALIGLARLCEESKAPSEEQINDVFGNLGT